jgi:excisionase family DNA binding protein
VRIPVDAGERCGSDHADPPDVMSAQLLTAEQLAERWQVKPSQIYRLSRERELPTVRIGRYYRYSIDAVEAFERGDVDTERKAA